MIKLKFLIFCIFFSSRAVFAENEDKKEVVEDVKVDADFDGKENQELGQREFDTIGKFHLL